MTYAELEELVQALIDLPNLEGIALLMTPETSQLVRDCNEAILKPEEQFDTKSLETALLFYDTLIAGLNLVATVDDALQWFNSSFTYAAIAGTGFQSIAPVIADELERLDIIGQEKIFDPCS